MKTVEEAYESLIVHFRALGSVVVPLREARDRVLAADVVSPDNVPSFANSAMDGYAVRQADLAATSEENPIVLKVVGESAAGHPPRVAVTAGTAVRIMTGAPMPEGADAVVMREETREHPDRVEILVPPEPGEHVRQPGEDITRGSVVLRAGDVLKPAALGVLASIGVGSVAVIRRPRVALLATGDELVDVDTPVGPGQIRNSSAYALEALVEAMGAIPVQLGIARDEREHLKSKLGEGSRADLLITTGGVSVGDHDLVKALLAELGHVDFWRVNMQPGKPLAFGHLSGTPVLGLPGNPVSSLVAFELFARPAIRKLQGHTRLQRPAVRVTLAAPIEKRGDRRQYLRAAVTWEDGAYIAHLAGAQGSHVLSAMARGNALLVLPAGPKRYAAGDKVDALLLEEGESYACGNSDPE